MSAFEKDLTDRFSQNWLIYRVVTHSELGGLELLPLFKSQYTYKDLLDMVEMIEAYDAVKEKAIERAKNTK